MKIFRFSAVLLVTCIFLSTCRQEEAPADPCAGRDSVNAEFLIEELVGSRYFVGDTIYGLNKIRFTALQEADEYIWTLGAETIKTRSFWRTNFPAGWTNVKLVIKRKPNRQCFPYDDGIDSSTRNFYCWDWYSNINMELIGPYFPIYGTYRGHYTNNPSVEFDVTIMDTLWKNDINQPYFVGVLRGLPVSYFRTDEISKNMDIGHICSEFSPKALKLQFGGAGGAPFSSYRMPLMFGYAWLERSDPRKINIQYVFQDTLDFTKYSDTLFFTGTKIY